MCKLATSLSGFCLLLVLHLLIPKLLGVCTTRKGMLLVDFTLPHYHRQMLAFSEGEEGKEGGRRKRGKRRREKGKKGQREAARKHF